MNCDISEVDKQLLFGILLEIPSLHINDIEQYKIHGQIYIERVLKKSDLKIISRPNSSPA
ncbi:conjugal transfer protein TraD [Klebsiella pneumoniae]|uniref:conjugal transfer protein TraD n=1 Tax=Klebsiella pneumoniae TaxID=573 RepID=UPI00396F5D19